MRTKWVTLVAILLVPYFIAGTTLVISLLQQQPTVYEASVLVTPEPDWGDEWETGVPGIEFIPPAVRLSQEDILRVGRAIRRPAIAEEAIRRLGLRMAPEELLDGLSTTVDVGEVSVILSYEDTDPQRARKVANTVARVAAEEVRLATPYNYDLEVWVLGQAKLSS